MADCYRCGVERTDYEGPNGQWLPECPNCGSTHDPVVWTLCRVNRNAYGLKHSETWVWLNLNDPYWHDAVRTGSVTPHPELTEAPPA